MHRLWGKNHSQHLLGTNTQRKNTYKGMFQDGNNSLHSDVSEPGGCNFGSSFSVKKGKQTQFSISFLFFSVNLLKLKC